MEQAQGQLDLKLTVPNSSNDWTVNVSDNNGSLTVAPLTAQIAPELIQYSHSDNANKPKPKHQMGVRVSLSAVGDVDEEEEFNEYETEEESDSDSDNEIGEMQHKRTNTKLISLSVSIQNTPIIPILGGIVYE